MRRSILLVALAAAMLWPTTGAQAACGWTTVPTPNKGTTFSNFSTAIDFGSSDDGWVVGYYWDDSSVSTLFSMHWDGAAWEMVRMPTPGGEAVVYGVDSLGNGTAWAVGYTTGVSTRALRLFWNGTRWVEVPGPPTEPDGASLMSISARGPKDIWAVGGYSSRSLVEHWDGTSWRKVKHPSVDTNQGLNAVTTVPGSKKVWVGGSHSGSVTQAPFALLWTGRKWRNPAMPSPASQAQVEDLFAVAPDDVWGVGYRTDMPFTWGTFTTHWDGAAWTTADSPHPSTGFPGEFLYGVTGTSTDAVYAAGTSQVAADSSNDPLVIRWDGTWSDQTPVSGTASFELREAARIPGTNQVAFVGFERVGGRFETRVIQGC